MADKLAPGVSYIRHKIVRKEFCSHTIETVLPHAIEIGTTTICAECLLAKLSEVMYNNPQSTLRLWCATCKQFRQTEDGICLTCGGKDLRD